MLLCLADNLVQKILNIYLALFVPNISLKGALTNKLY